VKGAEMASEVIGGPLGRVGGSLGALSGRRTHALRSYEGEGKALPLFTGRYIKYMKSPSQTT